MTSTARLTCSDRAAPSEAEAKKAAADADKAAGDAARAQLTALIPDFSKVQVPETKLGGTQPLFGSLLAHRALEDAATALVSALQPKLSAGDGAVLVTNDADLASSDAAYL